jgi:hypothetical protein
MHQDRALVLQVDQIVGVTRAIIKQRDFGEARDFGPIHSHRLIVGNATEEIIVRRDRVTR